MPNREIHNQIHAVPLIVPVAARTDNTPIVSAIIDNANFNSLEFVFITGTNTDTNATFAVTVVHGDDPALADAAAVPASQLVGTLAQAAFTFADDNECRKLGYIGGKRYTQATVTPSGNDSGNIFLAGVALLGGAATGPTANPPQ